MEFVFVSDNLALDFAGTVESRCSDAVDLLATGEDLGRWVRQAGLLDELPRTPSQTELGRAKLLREALYDVAATVVDDRKPYRSGLRLINEFAEATPVLPRLNTVGSLSHHGDLKAAFSDVARSGIELLGSDIRTLIRRCARPDCTRLFLDRSRGKSRRWCGMRTCGNRDKAAAYRSRRRAGTHS